MCVLSHLCLTLCSPINYSLPGSSVHGIFQARILEWIAISYSRGSSQLRNWTGVSCIAGGFFTNWAIREALKKAEQWRTDAFELWCWRRLLDSKEIKPTGQSYRKPTANIHRKDWCWSWISNTLATWWEEPTHWKRPWCWERLTAKGEKGDRRWDG